MEFTPTKAGAGMSGGDATTLRSSPRSRSAPSPACGGGLGRGWPARILLRAPSLSLPRKRGRGRRSRMSLVGPYGGQGRTAERANPTPPRALLGARTNGAATHVEGALAACGGAGGVRGLERRRPPPPSRLLRLLRRAQPIQRRRLAARPRRPNSGTRSRAG